MKKALLGALAAVGIIAIAGVALAVMRPDLLPAWAKPPAQAQVADSGLFCKEHGVPEKFCTLCHPELKEKLLLCTEHGNIPEDICTLCHPERRRRNTTSRCASTACPKHFCFKCHPENFEEGGRPGSANLINDGWCAEFGEAGPDGKSSCASSSRSSGSRRRSSRQSRLQDGPCDRGGARPRARRQRRDGLRRQPLRRDHPARRGLPPRGPRRPRPGGRKPGTSSPSSTRPR